MQNEDCLLLKLAAEVRSVTGVGDKPPLAMLPNYLRLFAEAARIENSHLVERNKELSVENEHLRHIATLAREALDKAASGFAEDVEPSMMNLMTALCWTKPRDTEPMNKPPVRCPVCGCVPPYADGFPELWERTARDAEGAVRILKGRSLYDPLRAVLQTRAPVILDDDGEA